MKSKVTVLLVLLWLASSAAAWSDQVDKRLCQDVVTIVWGPSVASTCLDAFTSSAQNGVCSLYVDQAAACSSAVVESPAEIPNQLGEGLLEQAGNCPVTRTPELTYLCAQKNDALDKARYWTNASAYAGSQCERIYDFCVAGNYLAQAYDPFTSILNEDRSCLDVTNRRIDFAVTNNQTNWGTNEVCNFNYNIGLAGGAIPKNFSQNIQVTSRIITSVVNNLTAEARLIKNRPYPKEASTTSTTLAESNVSVNPQVACVNDSDCILVQSGCCTCNEGGSNIALATSYKDQFLASLTGKCANIVCPQVISTDTSCNSSVACVAGACELQQTVASTTTSTTATTTSVTSTTEAAPPLTTESTTTTVPPTTTTLAQGSSFGSIIIYVIIFLVIAAGAYFLAAPMMRGPDEGSDEREARSGLRGFGGKEGRIESYGSSRLGDADRSAKPREKVPLKERQKEKPPEEYVAPPPRREEEAQPDKRKIRSLFQEPKNDDTTLGKR